MKERASYYGLDKTKNFEEYKEKYLIASSTINNYGLGANSSDFAKIPQHEAPILLKTIDYNDKNIVLSELKEFEKMQYMRT